MENSHFFQIKNMVNNSADIYFYGDIIDNTGWKWDDSDVMPDDIKNLLDEIKDVSNINMYINSGGGSVFAGLAIYNMLKRHKAYKTAYIDGVGASIASVIPFAADRVVIPTNAFLMVHKPWLWKIGNSNDFRKTADDLDKIEQGMMNVYKENLKEGVDIETIQQLVDAETWLTGEEASQYFNIEVSEANNAAACTSEFFAKYKKTPGKILKAKATPVQQTVQINEKQKIQNELELLAL